MFNILIVDDHKIQRTIIDFIINEKLKNVNIYEATNGEEAVNLLLENSNINFIIMDITMPKCDGIEATKMIRLFNQKVIIYGCSAISNYDLFRDKCFKVGMNGIFDKPFKPEYINIIKNYIKSSS